MVTGIDSFKEWFKGKRRAGMQSSGGTACDISDGGGRPGLPCNKGH